MKFPYSVNIAPAPETGDPIAILGHQGFLDFFTATFDGEDCTVQVQPNATLPAVH